MKTHLSSPAYATFVAVMESVGLPHPEPEFLFAPPRKWRFDFAWPEQGIALEIDGGIWTAGRHVRGKGFLDDMLKLNEAALQGWLVLRVTPQMIQSGAALALIERAFDVPKE